MNKNMPEKQPNPHDLPKKKPNPQLRYKPNTPVNPVEEKVLEPSNYPPESLPWIKLVTYLNESYQDFIPQNTKNQKYQENNKQLHQRCVEVISENSLDDWQKIISQKFTENDQKGANNFYFRLSNRYRESPNKFRQILKTNLCRFVELIEYALTESENRDLVRISEFVDVINSFGNTSEQTFFFLSKLPSVLDEDIRNILLHSIGYQQILKWGASPMLRKFGLQFQRKFRLTRTAIKDEAAQNLARELGETETVLTNQIEQLIEENERLQNSLETVHTQASQTAIYNLAKLLQSQAQPVLDQIFTLHQKLEKMSEAEDGLSVTSSEALSILITLESLLKAFHSLNITTFPKNINKPFELDSNQLGEYSYIEGSAFTNNNNKKKVCCVFPGWRVGEEIITPARVKEVSE
jgi:hypothetical protein